MKESIERVKVWWKVMTYYFYDRSGQFISLTFDRERFRTDAQHVLVWAFADEAGEKIVLTRHGNRGWEVPGGKVEMGETPEEAAHRELFEETGIRAAELHWIGQYIIYPESGKGLVVKNIYVGMARDWNDIPAGFETLERGIFPVSLIPFRLSMSPFIQDNVFPLCRAYIAKHLRELHGVRK
ncbi:hypothetical protein ADA01nite_07750 [Aneurinibacillus danicus]|uniref:Nudix hydrolase domain-containing protein n=2 Tax=Aneurinibacillus danicus TaxID=267746 RepID=A0A511V333_9BACL|nr:hypothetical protein ADA01nite_07750 [Aneurinibacillus danicus]